MLKFPQGFFWGASTSSHQVEGNNFNNWSEWEKNSSKLKIQNSKLVNWDNFILKNYPNPLQEENYLSGKACDHYHKYKEDFKLAKKLGHNAHRFSIEWSRIEPQEGKFSEKEIDHYQNVIKELLNLKIEPFVTLWHWTNPVWLEDIGGFKNKKSVFYFARYVKKIVKSFGKNVKFIITINEPEIYAKESFLKGNWPPGEKSVFSFFAVISNLIKAHKKAYKIIKEIDSCYQIGIANNIVYYEAYKNKIINRILKFLADLGNYYFLDKIKNHQDFVGLNYYFHNLINYGFNQQDKLGKSFYSEFGWELYPKGIYYVCKNLAKKYKKPIYITENGLADARDRHRIWFIIQTLKYIHKAISKGIDVRGYLHWSLMDNFEWDKGFWPRFGLVEVDYKTQKRIPRPSAEFYKKICINNQLEIVDSSK